MCCWTTAMVKVSVTPDKPRCDAIMIARSKFRFVVVALVAVAAWAMWPRAILSHNPTTTTVLFNREIVAVLQNKCLQCHGDGKMAMSLATYASPPWAVAMKEEVLARRMPPWPTEAGYGAFANDVGLTTREMDFLVVGRRRCARGRQ